MTRKSRLVAHSLRGVRCLLLASLSTAALAQRTLEVNFSNATGSVFGSSAGLQFTNGTLVSVGQDGQAPFLSGTVGTVTFTTPALKSGDVVNGGTFPGGGSFYISGGFDVNLSATFIAGDWHFVTLPNGTHNYMLKARITGTMFFQGTIYNIRGTVIELSTNTGKGLFGGSQLMSGGSTSVVTVP
jgi:hypothetical protein